MSHPWDARARPPAPAPHERLYVAMRRAGMRVVDRRDVGDPGRWTGSEYTFACGCVRTYRADVRTITEAEFVVPCEDHRNLLTSLANQSEDHLKPGRQVPGSSETETPDGPPDDR